MSTTITQTEEQTVQNALTAELLTGDKRQSLRERRETFTRTASIEKLKKFNNYICSQHYYIVPTLLVWLKTSHTLLTSNAEKCIEYMKSMFLFCAIRELVQLKLNTLDSETKKHAFYKLSAKDVLPILNIFVFRIQRSLALVYEDVKYLSLVLTVYFGVCLVFLQLTACILCMFVGIPSLGFMFLVGCVLIISKLVIVVMYQNVCKREKKLKIINNNNKTVEEKKRIRRQLTYIGKTISNVKLF